SVTDVAVIGDRRHGVYRISYQIRKVSFACDGADSQGRPVGENDPGVSGGSGNRAPGWWVAGRRACPVIRAARSGSGPVMGAARRGGGSAWERSHRGGGLVMGVALPWGRPGVGAVPPW